MKIKVSPFPDYTITNEAFERDVVPNTRTNVQNPPLSGHLIMIIEHKDGSKSFNSARPIQVADRKYVSPFPNPVHLYLSLAVEHFEVSEKIKLKNFPECGKEYSPELFLLDADPGSTHDCYNKYFMYRMGSIILLVSALEAFMNHIIPNSFIYTQENKQGQYKDLDKEQIESTRVSFKEKLVTVIPLALKTPLFWDGKVKYQTAILELYRHRTRLIHLKTNAKSDLERYFGQIDEMLDFDIWSAINSSIIFMNDANPDFIKVTQEN